MATSDSVKQVVLDRIAAGKSWWKSGRSTYEIKGTKVHVRYCSPPTYKFNINPNTLRADWEYGFVEMNLHII